jgi:chemosensory pili system protein ChpA (sensor histidine kinase/response regulator)
MGLKRILVVEDVDAIRRSLSRYLEEEGYEVFCARDGLEAYRILHELSNNLPGLILLDLIMPAMNGIQLATLLRHDSRLHHIPLIIMSGWPATETAKQIGASGVLCKPFEPASLAALAAKYCGNEV